MMTTQTPAKPRRARRSLLFPLSADHLLPRGLERLPKPIAAANEAAHEAVARYQTAQVAAREAGDQAAKAPRFDQIAVEAALAVGEDAPPATAQPRREKAEEAQRVAAAAENVAKQAVRALYDTIEDRFADFAGPRHELAAHLAEPLREAIPAFVEQLVKFRSENALATCAANFHNNPNSAALSAGVGNAEGIRRQYDKALQRRRQSPKFAPIPNEVAELLAALALLLEREIAEGAA